MSGLGAFQRGFDMSELDDFVDDPGGDFRNEGVCAECEDFTDLDEDGLCATCAKALREEDEGGFESSDFEDRPDMTRLKSPRDQER